MPQYHWAVLERDLVQELDSFEADIFVRVGGGVRETLETEDQTTQRNQQ